MITDDILLIYPDFSEVFYRTTDASSTVIGAVLQQKDDNGHFRPLHFFSETLSPAQCNYSTIGREALVVVRGLQIYMVRRL